MGESTVSEHKSNLKESREIARMVVILRLLYGLQVAAWTLIIVNHPATGTLNAGIVSILFSIGCLILVHFRRLALPRFFAPLALLIACAYILIFVGGIHSTVIAAVPLVILFAALLLDRVGAVIYAVLLLGVVAVAAIAEVQGIFNVDTNTTSLRDILDFAVIIGATTAVIWVLIGNMRADLEDARESELSVTKAKNLLTERTDELEKQQKVLEESETRYRFLADNLTDVVTVTDSRQGTTIYCSPSVTAQNGYSPEEFMETRVDSIIKPEYMESFRDSVKSAYRSIMAGEVEADHPRTASYEVNCKDGGSVWIENIFKYILDDDGNPTSIISVSRDITQRKEDEAERDSVQKQVQSMQKMEEIGLLAGGIAHDFNNLLTGIIGNADLALMKIDETAEARENIESLIASSTRATQLCNQLLAYAGKGRFLVQPLNLTELVGEMVSLLEVSISKKATLHMDLDSALPSVEMDATQIRQIVMNLIINAADAIDERDGDIKITTSKRFCDQQILEQFSLNGEELEGEYVFLEVTDSGAGMDSETQAKIFDPFFTSKALGNGLGLSAVMGIVRGHGGGINVYSELGVGSTFKIILPISSEEAIHIETTAPKEIPLSEGGVVLLVDDEEIILTLGLHALTSHGFEVHTARDGRKAVEIYKEHMSTIDAVILDMTMPVMGGEETFRSLREINSTLPIILSSGYDEHDTVSRNAVDGMSGFLQKPYRIDELLSVVSGVLVDSRKEHG